MAYTVASFINLYSRFAYKFINIYVNDEDVRFIGGLDLALNAGDNVTILPAVAGGAKNCGAI